jgi:hypothetical protein
MRNVYAVGKVQCLLRASQAGFRQVHLYFSSPFLLMKGDFSGLTVDDKMVPGGLSANIKPPVSGLQK